MKNKKLIMYIGIILLISIIIGIGYLVYINIGTNDEGDIITEYTPQAEITDEQLRKTIVTLYFMNSETNKLMPEPRQIDVKELIENPYSTLVNLLIGGPKNEGLTRLLPDATVLNEAKIIGNVVYLDFSEGFIKDQNLGKEKEELIMNSIVNTLTELVEVNTIVITIDGVDNMEFPDGEVNFRNPFLRQN